MQYIFDTNMLVYLIRKHPKMDEVNELYKPFDNSNIAIISIVTQAEIFSLAYQFKWGEEKLKSLKDLLSQFLVIPIYAEDIVNAYAQIDVYSQGKLQDNPLPEGVTSRNMGKNDIWIAATSHITKATLLTTDGDFDHLNNYCNIVKIVI